MDKAKLQKPKICCECGNRIMGGQLGKDIHFITNRGETRWYCQKCMEKLLKGQ